MKLVEKTTAVLTRRNGSIYNKMRHHCKTMVAIKISHKTVQNKVSTQYQIRSCPVSNLCTELENLTSQHRQSLVLSKRAYIFNEPY